MKQTNTCVRLGLLAALALVAPGLHAQASKTGGGADDLSYHLKVRTGSTGGSLATANDNKRQFGFSLAGAMPWRNGRLTAELTYDFYAGRNADHTKASGPIYFDPSGKMDGSQAVTSVGGQALYLDPRTSIDLRKHSVSGFGARAGYTARLPFAWAEGWNWQGGLSLERLRTKYEIAQTLIPVYGPDQTPAGNLWGYDPDNPDYYEGLAAVKQSTKLAPGAYIGLATALTEDIHFEVNARTLGFSKVDYAPFTYTGKKSVVSESVKYGFAIEFALGLKL